MSTTAWIQPNTRARLQQRKETLGAPSIDAVIQDLLDRTEETAEQLFARRANDVRTACQAAGVQRLVAFGSRARGDAGPTSDLDLAYDLSPERQATFDLFDHIDLQEALAKAFGTRIDVVRIGGTNRTLAQRIEQEGVILIEPTRR